MMDLLKLYVWKKRHFSFELCDCRSKLIQVHPQGCFRDLHNSDIFAFLVHLIHSSNITRFSFRLTLQLLRRTGFVEKWEVNKTRTLKMSILTNEKNNNNKSNSEIIMIIIMKKIENQTPMGNRRKVGNLYDEWYK